LVDKSLEVINCFKPKLLPAATHSTDHQLFNGLLYILCSQLSCMISAFTDTKVFSFASNTVIGAVCETVLACCGNFLGEWH